MGKTTSFGDFLRRANAVHENRYDYRESSYRGATSPVEATCKDCGTDFTVNLPSAHIYKKIYKCPECFPVGCKILPEQAERVRTYLKANGPARFPCLCKALGVSQSRGLLDGLTRTMPDLYLEDDNRLNVISR